MDYIFITALFVLCAMLHIGRTISKLKKDFPMFNFRQVIGTFFSQNWDTLIGSATVLGIYELVIFILLYNGIVFPYWFDMFGMYALAGVLGYQGQRLFYKWLDTAVDALEKKADQLKDKVDNIK